MRICIVSTVPYLASGGRMVLCTKPGPESGSGTPPTSFPSSLLPMEVLAEFGSARMRAISSLWRCLSLTASVAGFAATDCGSSGDFSDAEGLTAGAFVDGAGGAKGLPSPTVAALVGDNSACFAPLGSIVPTRGAFGLLDVFAHPNAMYPAIAIAKILRELFTRQECQKDDLLASHRSKDARISNLTASALHLTRSSVKPTERCDNESRAYLTRKRIPTE
jgi:hypothetical protein